MNYSSGNMSNGDGNRTRSNNEQRLSEQENISRLIQPHACVFCHKSAVCVCQRCGDFYCSPECQRRDWSRHRYICLPMPQLVQASYVTNINDLPLLYRNNVNHSILPTTSINGNKTEMHTDNMQMNYKESVRREESSTTLNKYQQEQKNHNAPSTSVNAAAADVPMNTFSEYPKNDSRVILTGFRSPNRCFIRSIAENDGFLKISKLINDCGKTAPKFINLPNLGEYALTTFRSDSCFYRVQIIAIRNSNGIRVLYIDWGNTGVKKLSELRKIPNDIIQLKRYVLPIALKDVPNYNIDEKLLKYLEQFENLECRVEYIRKDDKNLPECILRTYNSKQNVNEELKRFARSNGNNYGIRKTENKEGSFENEKNDENNRGSGNGNVGDRFRKSQQMMGYEKKSNINGNRETVTDRLERLSISSQRDNEEKQQQQQQQQPQQKQKCEQSQLNEINQLQNIKKVDDTAIMVDKKEEIEQNKNSNVPEDKQQKEEKIQETSKSSIVSITKSSLKTQSPVLEAPFEIKLFKVGAENFQVIPVDNSMIKIGCFGCLEISDIKIFQKVQTYTSNFKDTERPYRPVLNEFCMAQFEGDWYRAKVTECSSDLAKFTVTYIDFTNEGVVSPKEIRQYPDDFTLPCCSNLCVIEDLPEELNPKQIAFLQNKFEAFNTTHIITKVSRIEENCPLVKIDGILKDLQDASLL